jgi:hypothetical protein
MATFLARGHDAADSAMLVLLLASQAVFALLVSGTADSG